jgi:PAS domain S-box-containing protein
MHMIMADLEGRILEISPTFFETILLGGGFTRAAVMGRRVTEIETGVENTARRIIERLAAGEATVEADVPLALAGRRLVMRVLASYWRDDTGRPIAILYVYQDVTAESEAQAALAESAAQLRAVVENMPAQISLMDVESGRILLMNASMTHSLATYGGVKEGDSADERLTAENKANLARLVAEVGDGGLAQVEGTMQDGPAAGRTFRMKYVIFHDGRGRKQLLWTGEDITELRDAAAALERAVGEAEAANRAKSEFLANMSHEIRTPLNGVMGVAGALARTELSPAQHEMVELIETSAKTLEALLSDILDLARIEAGKVELRSEPFDLTTSVNACGALFDAAAQAKGLDLDVRIAPEALGAYMGDAARIRQVLSNLLSNAVKFTQVGRVTLRVLARPGDATTELRFEVSDTGIGFDAETKVRLFSRFEQADGSITRRFGGSGLGLSISRSLAEAMGGRLEADAAPGKGSVFTLVLDLPRCAIDADEAAEPEGQADPLLGLRVLLAEDHPTNRRVVELILGAAGVDLTCVENGVEAVDAFRRRAFDLILMDMQMPLMDGLAAIEEIRKIEAAAGAPRMPIHVLTANAMPEHISASIAAGADVHLSKPILADALLERVAETAVAVTRAR